jgi:hypothetical protein
MAAPKEFDGFISQLEREVQRLTTAVQHLQGSNRQLRQALDQEGHDPEYKLALEVRHKGPRLSFLARSEVITFFFLQTKDDLRKILFYPQENIVVIAKVRSSKDVCLHVCSLMVRFFLPAADAATPPCPIGLRRFAVQGKDRAAGKGAWRAETRFRNSGHGGGDHPH